MVWKNGCMREDESGRRCCWGPGHKGGHRFTGLDLTEDQWAMLLDLAVRGRADVFGGGGPVARVLANRRLIERWTIGSRWWKLSLTKHGRDVLNERPR